MDGVKGAKKQGLGKGKGTDLRQGDLQADGRFDKWKRLSTWGEESKLETLEDA